MYGAEDPSIAGMVLDSPFSDLVDLMMELVDTYKVRLPKFTVKFAIQYMRRAIQKKAKFDIMDLNTFKVAKACFVPVLFGHATDDDFIQPHHSDHIFDAYVGDKNIIKFEGDHNSPRPQFYFDSICIFFNNVLQPPNDEIGSTYFDLNHQYFGKSGLSAANALEFSDELDTPPSGEPSTVDAIKQLRYRRPMSSIVVPADVTGNDELDVQVESRESDSHPSSSSMISFELSNDGHHCSRAPTSIDDDEYVEYAFETLANFPCNVEEEERMLMEAVLESLKDVEAKKPPFPVSKIEQEDSTWNDSKKEPVTISAAEEHQLDPQTPETCSSNDVLISNTKFFNIDGVNHRNDVSTVVNSRNADNAGPSPATEEGKNGEKSPFDEPSSENQSTSGTDMNCETKVTVKVVKNPTNNIVDGLLRRWDMNFFRNR